MSKREIDVLEVLGALMKIQHECNRDAAQACRLVVELLEYIEARIIEKSPI